MFVGTADIIDYQYPGLEFDLVIRLKLVKHIKEAVVGIGKKVTVTYY